MKNIIFTKLGTVKFNDQEYTYEDFFLLMKRNISFNVDKNKVRYDEENNCFVIKIDNANYQVLYGQEVITKESDKKDIVKLLHYLIEFTDKKRIEKKEKKEQQEKEKKDNEIIIENGDKGIFNSDEDKLVYIEYLKKEIKRIKALVEEEYPMRIVIYAGAIPSAIVVAMTLLFQSPLFLMFLLIIGGGIFAAGFVVKNRMESYITKIRPLKKKIESLEKTLSKNLTKNNQKMNELVEEAEKNGLEEKNENKTNPAVEVILKDFEELTKKIDQIESVEKKKEYSKGILQIINSFKVASKSFDLLSARQDITNQIVNLSSLVDGTIREEESIRRSQREFEEMLDEVNRVASRR